MRIDYYRMMRKWRTDLYRYGLRLTFDLTIPNPGARLWALYRRVNHLDARLREPFSFPLQPEDLTEANWESEAANHGVVIDPPAPGGRYAGHFPISSRTPTAAWRSSTSWRLTDTRWTRAL